MREALCIYLDHDPRNVGRRGVDYSFTLSSPHKSKLPAAQLLRNGNAVIHDVAESPRRVIANM